MSIANNLCILILQTELQAALSHAGYDTPEKIVDLVQEVKRELLQESIEQ
jgi:hypothetical protein